MCERHEQTTCPPVPTEVGDCESCGGAVYDYEATHCPTCGRLIHGSCLKSCAAEGCAGEGCGRCMVLEPESGEHVCGSECLAHVRGVVVI